MYVKTTQGTSTRWPLKTGGIYTYIRRCFTVVEWMQWIMITQHRLSLSRGGL